MKDGAAGKTKREKQVNVRLDLELFKAASERARALGGLSVVIRTLLRRFADGKIVLRKEDVVDELLPPK
jgi:hypothetical protein